MAMASTATAAASLRLAFPLLSAPASSSSYSNTLRFPLRRRSSCRPLAVAAFKKLSEASPVPIPQEPTQPLLVDEDALPPKAGVYGVYDPAGELQFVGISRNVRASVEGHRRKVPANLCASVKVRHELLSVYIIILLLQFFLPIYKQFSLALELNQYLPLG